MFKATNIATTDEIFSNCGLVQGFIEAHYESDNAAACVDRATQAEAYMGLTSKMLADAKYQYSQILNSEFVSAIMEGNKANMSASILGKYIDTLCRDYKYLVDWSERLNRACTHCIDLQRSIISKHKEEARLAGWQRTT